MRANPILTGSPKREDVSVTPTKPTSGAAEASSVQQWRLQELVRAGYPPYEALLLSRTDVDLHDATRLVRRGCPPRTAVRIVL